MFFKLETFLLLLTLADVLAGETVPTIPYPNVDSPLHRLTQVRRSLLYIPQTSVRDTAGLPRALRYATPAESNCVWDSEHSTCTIGLTITQRLLQGSNSEYSDLLLNDLGCVRKPTKFGCNTDQKCFWEEEHKLCFLTDLRTGHENSACIKAAPLLFRGMAALGTCSKPNNKLTCEKQSDCAWSPKFSCFPDIFKIWFGIDDFEEKVDKVNKEKMPTIATAYLHLKSSGNVTWDSVLKWQVPKTECPADAEKLICEYVDALDAVIVGPALYCSGKYNSYTACNADENCNWDWSSRSCGPTEATVGAAAFAASNVLMERLPEGIDKQFMNTTLSCVRALKEADCKDGCKWDQENEFCEPMTHHLYKIVEAMPKNSTDGVCQYLLVDDSTACVLEQEKGACEKSKSCLWYTGHGCVGSLDFYISAAAEADPQLKTQYKDAKDLCSSFTEQQTCSVRGTGTEIFTFTV